MSQPLNTEKLFEKEYRSSDQSDFASTASLKSPGLLASSASSHPHLISRLVEGLHHEANATPGLSSHPHSTTSLVFEPHLIGDHSRPSFPDHPLGETSEAFHRLPLHSIPETGNGGSTPFNPSQQSARSRKRSSSDFDRASSISSPSTSNPNGEKLRSTKRGRRPLKLDMKSKLEKSRQSARECRARKKLRYQYLEELVAAREKAIFSLREELEMYKSWCKDMDEGKIPPDMKSKMEKLEKKLVMPGDERQSSEAASIEDDDDDDVDSDEDDDSEEFEEEDDEEEGEKTTAGSN